MKILLLAAGFSLLLSGCGGAESDAKKAVLGSLKDPDSAKFGKFTQVNEKIACLTVNARNAMGGYTGDQQATLTQVNKKWVVASIDETSHDNCISSIKYLEQQVLEKQQQNELVKKQVEAQIKRCSEIKDCFEMVGIPGKSYEMGKYEITQGQWKAVMGDNPSHFSSCGDTCPVEQVSWNDAQEFIGKLNQKTGKQYRLPTEAEWEYACYGGSQSEYCGGSDINSVAWYKDNSGGQTHPVGQKQANGYGLYDMSGNVEEWMENKYDNEHDLRVLRGGCWFSGPRFGRAVDRSLDVSAYRSHFNGFRLARTLP